MQTFLLHVPREDLGETDTKRRKCIRRDCSNHERWFRFKSITTDGIMAWCFEGGFMSALDANQIKEAQRGWCSDACRSLHLIRDGYKF